MIGYENRIHNSLKRLRKTKVKINIVSLFIFLFKINYGNNKIKSEINLIT